MKNINLIGKYHAVKNSDAHEYKGNYNKLFPSKMSSSGFLTLFSLYVLDRRNEPVYGKEIIHEIESMLDSSVWSPSHGTLYPVLEKLSDANMIKTIKEKNSRKYYIITDEGRELLQSKLSEFKESLTLTNVFFDNIVKKLYSEK